MTTDELSDFRPACYRDMGRDDYHAGVEQMLADLEEYARRDGCIAAAWALAVLRELPGPDRYAKLLTAARNYVDSLRGGLKAIAGQGVRSPAFGAMADQSTAALLDLKAEIEKAP